MRVLFVYEQYIGGGFETHLDALVEALVESGVEVCCLGGPEFAKSPVRHLVSHYSTADFQTFSGSTIESCARRIADLVNRERIDVVHAHPFLSFLPAALGASLAGVPYLITFHGPPNLPLWSSYFGGFFVESLAKFVLPHAAVLSCHSEDARDELAGAFGIDAAALQILRNPVNTERFRPAGNKRDGEHPRALLISRLDDDKYKSCISAMDLFRALREQEAHWRFAAAGTGNRESDLRSYAQQTDLCEVEWLGCREDVDSLLQSADVVVGMGRVVLEAMAAECVTVIAGFAGLVGVVEPGTFSSLQRGNFDGRSVPPASPLTMAHIVKASLKVNSSHTQLLRNMVCAGHSARRIAESWLDLYESAVSAKLRPEADQEARSALSWLGLVGQNSLRSLQWTDQGITWPFTLLRAPAGGALLQQAMEVRSKEAAEQAASTDTLRHRVSQLQSECDRLRIDAVENVTHLKGKLESLSSAYEQSLEFRATTAALRERLERVEADRVDLAARLEEEHRQRLEAQHRIVEAVSNAQQAELEKVHSNRELEALRSAYEQSIQLQDAVAALRERLERAETDRVEVATRLEEEHRQRLEAERRIGEAVSTARQAELDRQQRLLLEAEASARTILDYSSRLCGAEERALGLATTCEELRLSLKEANGRCRALEEDARSSEDLGNTLRTELAQKEAKHRELLNQVGNLQGIVEAQETQLAGLRAALQRAEETRKLTLNRCHQFRTTFEDQFAVYSSQRAWQIMLWFRKAYALFFSSPLLGKLKFFHFAFASLFGRGNPTDYQLTFPSLPAYMPRQVMEPFTTNGASPATPTPASPLPSPGLSPLPELPRPKKYDVVILGIIDFDFRFQRPQQLAVKFAQEGHRVFWISPTRYLSPSGSRPYELIDLRENLWEVHLRGQQPDIYGGSLDAVAVGGFEAVLDEFYREANIVESCVFIQLPFWRQLGLHLRTEFGATLLYDCMDDWETFPNFGRFNLSEEHLLASEANVLVVTARRLAEKFERHGLKPLLVRNGADYEFFANASGEQALLRGIPKPIVGYFGAIADWVDLDLVYAQASLRPRYSFVLIGKVFGRDVSRLQSLPNVHLLGHKEYEEIPSYLREFDVCIIPFVVNQVTNATDPVKLYEYFSQGKPVVASAMAELETWRDLVYIAGDATEFAEMLDQALAEKTNHQSLRRIEFARANTWKHRYEAIDGAIARTFPLVSVLIVTYNSSEFLRPCLDSILRNTTYPNFEIIIVDNASQDDTPSTIKRYASRHSRLKEFCLSENLGFAGGNNFAADRACGEYLVFLNADTLVTAGWLENLMRHYRKDGTIGLLTPITNFAGNEIKINVDYKNQVEMEDFAASLTRQCSGQRFDIEMAPLYCTLMPTQVWQRVGKLDERFDVGMFEDDDLSMRVRGSGFRVVAAEDCFIHHFGQGSFSKLEAEAYQRIFDHNRLLFEQKWQTTWKGHKPRNGVRPAHEEKRFDPLIFCEGGHKLRWASA